MTIRELKNNLKKHFPDRILFLYRTVRKLRNDWKSISVFLLDSNLGLSFKKRFIIIKNFLFISNYITCKHTQDEIITITKYILRISSNIKGCIIEAGAYKGGCSTKLSLIANIVKRKLIIFDSFEGIPDNDEPHKKSIFGRKIGFAKGDYKGTITEVKTNISKYGKIENCRLEKGWFKDTLPRFKEPIVAIFLDVDLASSTRTCLKYLYPLLKTSGVFFSHDGHVPLVLNVYNDDDFWEKEVGCKKPYIYGFGHKKLLMIVKD